MYDSTNKKIAKILQYYQPYEVKPDVWVGKFVTTRREQSALYKIRDNLTADEWEYITSLASAGYNLMPDTLRHSLDVKIKNFNDYMERNNFHGMTMPEILDSFKKGSQKYTEAQAQIWGVLTSCLESIWWENHYYLEKIKQNESLFEYP